MKKTILLLLFVATTGVFAQNVALWRTALPGHRQAFDLSSLPSSVFASHSEVIEKRTMPVVTDNGYIAKLSSLKVTGLVWNIDSNKRRVLMGDIVMREKQDIPSYVFNDGKTYTLQKIERDRLDFETADDASPNPVAFQVPFGLKENLKNESSYSSHDQK